MQCMVKSIVLWESYCWSDLRKAAAILKGKQVAKNVRVMVVPATQKIFVQCIHEGLAEIFVETHFSPLAITPICPPIQGPQLGLKTGFFLLMSKRLLIWKNTQ